MNQIAGRQRAHLTKSLSPVINELENQEANKVDNFNESLTRLQDRQKKGMVVQDPEENEGQV